MRICRKVSAIWISLVMLFQFSILGCAEGVWGLKMLRPNSLSLMYHKISENPAEQNAFCISPKEFEEDICYLKKQGYRFCTASETKDLSKWEKCVFITFDDGYESDYLYALPILEKYQAKATFFIIGSSVGQGDHITKKQLEQLSQSPLVEIGNHSYELHNLTVDAIRAEFYSGNATKILDDFRKNAFFLETVTKKPVRSISYPNGIWTPEIDCAMRTFGVVMTFTSNETAIKEFDKPCGRFNRFSGRDIKNVIKLR